MAIVNLQTCDMCSKQRDLGGRAGSSDGWRQVPVRKKYGDNRPEQPWLCPDCLEKVERYIDSNAKVEDLYSDALQRMKEYTGDA